MKRCHLKNTSGVVAAEMPADFEPEALKAQAVAARTYALPTGAKVLPTTDFKQIIGSQRGTEETLGLLPIFQAFEKSIPGSRRDQR